MSTVRSSNRHSARLGELVTYRKEVVHPRNSPQGTATFVGLEHIESQTGRRLGEVQIEMAELTGRKPRFHKGDIVYGYLRPYLNKVWVAEFDGLCSVDQYVFAVRKEVADTDFIAWFMRSDSYLKRAPVAQTPGQLPRIRLEEVASVKIELPQLRQQERVAAVLREQFAEFQRAHAATLAQSNLLDSFVQSVLRESLAVARPVETRIPDCLSEVTEGIGESWAEYPVLGATRAGLAPAKEGVGKNPGRYKPVRPGTIFYNPMRILLGSIAMLDDDDPPGITSPDYVVMTAVEGKLHPVWFYRWFRSPTGAEFIQSLTRGAVRERLLFNRLAPASIPLPTWEHQLAAVARIREAERMKQSLRVQLAEVERLPAALLRETFSQY